MGKIFTLTTNESFFSTIVQYVSSTYEEQEIYKLKIIVLYKRDAIALLETFKIFDTRRSAILPEIIALENIGEECTIDKTNLKTLLLIKLILLWNQNNKSNYPVDLAYTLLSLLDRVQLSKLACQFNLNNDIKKEDHFMDFLANNWSKTLRELGMLDTLEHKKNCIHNIMLSLQEDQDIIFVGFAKNKIEQSLIKAIYNLPYGKVILPNLNLKIEEKNWQLLNSKHYQYCLKKLLSHLNVHRSEVISLNIAVNDTIDYIFDTTAHFREITNQSNCELIYCSSEEEKAQIISLIVKNEGDTSLYIDDQSLATRVALLLNRYNAEDYSYATLLLYSIEALITNWNSIQLLSLLKHALVTFGYAEEKYNEIISELEIKVLRYCNINNLQEIVNIVNQNELIKYKEEILYIINRLKGIFNPLHNIICNSIDEIATVHLDCVNALSNVDFLHSNNIASNLISELIIACKNIKITCSLETYGKILTYFFKQHFFSKITTEFSLYKTKVVVLTNISNLPTSSLMQPFTSIQEEYGYFLYALYNLFCASKVYIILSLNNRKFNLLRRIDSLFNAKHSIIMLDKHEYREPYARPMPKPATKIRKEKMQLLPYSAVEKLICDPYAFYAEHILDLKKLRDLNFRPSMLEFGIVAHDMFKQPLLKHGCIMDITKQKCHFNFSNMWWIRLQKVLSSFIQLNKIYSHIDMEKDFSFPISKDITLTIKCDRIEYLKEDQVAIVEYKFSSFQLRPMQLLLQALVVEYVTKKKVVKLDYWQFDFDQVKIIPIHGYKIKMQELQEDMLTFLSTYLSEDTPFIASPYLDKFSPSNSYAHLERVLEWL